MSPSILDPNIPWQTNESQVGAFAYCEGLPKRGCVKGFAYVMGSGPEAKSIFSLDPSWQTAVVGVEKHLDEARAIIRRNRRTFHIRDPFGEACRVLNTTWIPKVNAILRDAHLRYYLDCVPVAVVGGTNHLNHRVHYAFIRVIMFAGGALSKTASFPLSLDAYSREPSSSSKPQRLPGVVSTTKPSDPPETTRLRESLRQSEESNRQLSRRVEELEQSNEGQITEIAELERQLQQERTKTASQEDQIGQLVAELSERTRNNEMLSQYMEVLIDQLREERLHNEEQAEQTGRLERRVKELTAELELLQCGMTVDHGDSSHGKSSKKNKKKQKKKDRASDPEKKSKKKKDKTKKAKDDGIMLHRSYDNGKTDEVEPTVEQTETEEMTSSSALGAHFVSPRAIGIGNAW